MGAELRAPKGPASASDQLGGNLTPALSRGGRSFQCGPARIRLRTPAEARSWTEACFCTLNRSTLSHMKGAITIRLDPDLEKLLDRLCKQTGRTRSELVRDALRQLRLLRFERLRRQTLPFAEARGYLTDEDVARDVS
jgi:predicted transcriptional regulator